MKLDSLDAVFAALAHPARRRMLDILIDLPGCGVNDVAKGIVQHFPMSRIAVMKHLKVLQGADLVVSRKNGRVREMYFNAAPIQLVYDRWTSQYSRFWGSHPDAFRFRGAESDTGPDREN